MWNKKGHERIKIGKGHRMWGLIKLRIFGAATTFFIVIWRFTVYVDVDGEALAAFKQNSDAFKGGRFER
jgi:hypothetical protein